MSGLQKRRASTRRRGRIRKPLGDVRLNARAHGECVIGRECLWNNCVQDVVAAGRDPWLKG